MLCESGDLQSPPPSIDSNNDIVKESVLKKKKRPGLTQTLIPSKKVMKMYAAQK